MKPYSEYISQLRVGGLCWYLMVFTRVVAKIVWRRLGEILLAIFSWVKYHFIGSSVDLWIYKDFMCLGPVWRNAWFMVKCGGFYARKPQIKWSHRMNIINIGWIVSFILASSPSRPGMHTLCLSDNTLCPSINTVPTLKSRSISNAFPMISFSHPPQSLTSLLSMISEASSEPKLMTPTEFGIIK